MNDSLKRWIGSLGEVCFFFACLCVLWAIGEFAWWLVDLIGARFWIALALAFALALTASSLFGIADRDYWREAEARSKTP